MNKETELHKFFSFHHIGSLTPNLDDAEKAFTAFGFRFTERVLDPIQDVSLSFGKNDLGILLELVQPNENSQVQKLLKRNGSGPYHFCFEVKSLSDIKSILKESGFICVKKPEKAIAFNNRLVSFHYSPNHGLIELLEI